MRKIAAIVVGLALVATTVPAATASQSVREENREFILSHSSNYDPDAQVEVHHDGTVETMRAEQALEMTLDRADDRDLARMANSATHGDRTVAGDVWVLGLGDIECGEPTKLAPQPVFTIPVQEQFWLYDGHVGYSTTSSAEDWWATAWTMKDAIQGSGTVSYGGISTFFCVEDTVYPIGWDGVLFPFVDGYVSPETVPPASP